MINRLDQRDLFTCTYSLHVLLDEANIDLALTLILLNKTSLTIMFESMLPVRS